MTTAATHPGPRRTARRWALRALLVLLVVTLAGAGALAVTCARAATVTPARSPSSGR